jgi:hypothetical protein
MGKLRDIKWRPWKHGAFIVGIPCDERDVRDFALLNKFLRTIGQKIPIPRPRLPGKVERLFNTNQGMQDRGYPAGTDTGTISHTWYPLYDGDMLIAAFSVS